MQDKILKTYAAFKGPKYTITAKDEAAARLAASHSSAELRTATVLAAEYERSLERTRRREANKGK